MILCERVKYEVVEKNLFSDELGSYKSFGITGKNELGEELVICPDVSPDRAFVEKLCERCNKFQLSPLHMLDVIEDSI